MDIETTHWDIFRWLLARQTDSSRIAAAALMCGWLESIIDGECVITGEPTELELDGKNPTHRALIYDSDRDCWDWLAQVADLASKNGPVHLSARSLVNEAKKAIGEASEPWSVVGELGGRERFITRLRIIIESCGEELWL